MHSGVSNPGLEPGGFVPAASDVSVGTPLIGVAQTCEVVSRSILLQTCVSGCDAGQTFANGDVFLSDWLMHATRHTLLLRSEPRELRLASLQKKNLS